MNSVAWIFEHLEIISTISIIIASVMAIGAIVLFILRLRCPMCKQFGRKLTQRVLVDKKPDLEEKEEQIPVYATTGEKTGYTTQTKQIKVTHLEYMNTYRCQKCGHVWTEPSYKTVKGWV